MDETHLWLSQDYLTDDYAPPQGISLTCPRSILWRCPPAYNSSPLREALKMTTTLSRSRQKSALLDELVPVGLGDLSDEQTAIPRIARDPDLTATIADAVERVPTAHRLLLGDSRDLSELESGSVHLVLTSPPYWTLKVYREASGQLGSVADYERFVSELDRVWRECFRLLAPGGRLVCVVGDVLLSRRRNNGRHVVVPLHATIQTHCRTLGFDNLAPIIWHKIGNADYEAGGGGFLGKPYEPNAIIKNDIEYVLFPAQTRRIPQSLLRHAVAVGHFSGGSPEVVPAGLDRRDRRIHETAPGSVPDGAGRPARADVQLRW